MTQVLKFYVISLKAIISCNFRSVLIFRSEESDDLFNIGFFVHDYSLYYRGRVGYLKHIIL